MHIPTTTCSLLALASLASSRALNLRPRRAMFDRDFDIPRLQTHASSGLNGTSTNITITCTHILPIPQSLPPTLQWTFSIDKTPKVQFHDQNTQTSSTCSATFTPSRTENGTTQNFFPTRRTACSPDPYFGWSFERFDGIESFALALSHTYQDPS